jgi:hypothetical protein
VNQNSSKFEQLQQLEESLWKAETRFDKKYMEKLLADDFFEFGRSGKTYTREEILHHPQQEIHAQFPLKEFQVHEISPTIFLVSYISEVQYEELEIGNRSSLWENTKEGWKLRFHQGTAVS